MGNFQMHTKKTARKNITSHCHPLNKTLRPGSTTVLAETLRYICTNSSIAPPPLQYTPLFLSLGVSVNVTRESVNVNVPAAQNKVSDPPRPRSPHGVRCFNASKIQQQDKARKRMYDCLFSCVSAVLPHIVWLKQLQAHKAALAYQLQAPKQDCIC